jgi:cytoskeletal protein CcmA (bactofilin family)
MNEMTSRSSSPASGTTRQTVLGQTVVLKGELSADEDLLIEGQFEGTLSLEQHCLTVGATGQVKAEIKARQAVILGTLTGKVAAKEKVEIRRSGHLVGDLATGAVAIEEGAYFKGSIEILRDEPKESPRGASPRSAAPPSAAPPSAAPPSAAPRSASGTSG